MTYPNWIQEYLNHDEAEIRRRKVRALAKAIYPSPWGGPRDGTDADDYFKLPDHLPKSSLGWAETGLRSMEKVRS